MNQKQKGDKTEKKEEGFGAFRQTAEWDLPKVIKDLHFHHKTYHLI